MPRSLGLGGIEKQEFRRSGCPGWPKIPSGGTRALGSMLAAADLSNWLVAALISMVRPVTPASIFTVWEPEETLRIHFADHADGARLCHWE